jgi:hypothetical protein
MAHIALANFDRSDSHKRDDTAPLEHLCYHFLLSQRPNWRQPNRTFATFSSLEAAAFFRGARTDIPASEPRREQRVNRALLRLELTRSLIGFGLRLAGVSF